MPRSDLIWISPVIRAALSAMLTYLIFRFARNTGELAKELKIKRHFMTSLCHQTLFHYFLHAYVCPFLLFYYTCS